MNRTEEKTFVLRFSLVATFPLDYAGRLDAGRWLDAWSQRIRPRIVRAALAEVSAEAGWRAQVAGGTADEEVEIAAEMTPNDAGPAMA